MSFTTGTEDQIELLEFLHAAELFLSRHGEVVRYLDLRVLIWNPQAFRVVTERLARILEATPNLRRLTYALHRQDGGIKEWQISGFVGDFMNSLPALSRLEGLVSCDESPAVIDEVLFAKYGKQLQVAGLCFDLGGFDNRNFRTLEQRLSSNMRQLVLKNLLPWYLDHIVGLIEVNQAPRLKKVNVTVIASTTGRPRGMCSLHMSNTEQPLTVSSIHRLVHSLQLDTLVVRVGNGVELVTGIRSIVDCESLQKLYMFCSSLTIRSKLMKLLPNVRLMAVADLRGRCNVAGDDFCLSLPHHVIVNRSSSTPTAGHFLDQFASVTFHRSTVLEWLILPGDICDFDTTENRDTVLVRSQQ